MRCLLPAWLALYGTEIDVCIHIHIYIFCIDVHLYGAVTLVISVFVAGCASSFWPLHRDVCLFHLSYFLPFSLLAGALTMPDFMAYIEIMRRLLGNEFVCAADIVAIPKESDRCWINEHIRQHRPGEFISGERHAVRGGGVAGEAAALS